MKSMKFTTTGSGSSTGIARDNTADQMVCEKQIGREFLMTTPFGVSTGSTQHFGPGVQVRRLVPRSTVDAQKLFRKWNELYWKQGRFA
jgi:phosphoribosyl 1,2-cyclic phosphodiesterase